MHLLLLVRDVIYVSWECVCLTEGRIACMFFLRKSDDREYDNNAAVAFLYTEIKLVLHYCNHFLDRHANLNFIGSCG